MTMTPEDLAAVQQLIARYAECLDERDLDGYLNNFAPDGEFENERGTIKGREAIGAWVGSIMGVDRVSGMRH
ncbi:MAG TPA: nuclear transport factor 2 family protein, partial [Dehalococcoidia bacterium]|nr:nuclear transport factor 2 family protein [Dehalococcoidia bacterium]